MEQEDIVKIFNDCGMKKENGVIDVFYNGHFVGFVDDVKAFVSSVKGERRQGNLPIEMSISFQENLDTIFMSTEVGRVLRPLIIVENGKPQVKEEHLEMAKQASLNWED